MTDEQNKLDKVASISVDKMNEVFNGIGTIISLIQEDINSAVDRLATLEHIMKQKKEYFEDSMKVNCDYLKMKGGADDC